MKRIFVGSGLFIVLLTGVVAAQSLEPCSTSSCIYIPIVAQQELTPTVEITPTNISAPTVRVIESTGRVGDRPDEYVVEGIIKNETRSTIYHVIISVTLFQGVNSAPYALKKLTLASLDADEKATFKTTIFNPSIHPESYSVDLEWKTTP